MDINILCQRGSRIRSEGEPGKVMEGKRIITGAVIGLILTISASVISDTLVKVIGGVAK